MAEWNDGPQYRQQHPLQWVNRMLDWALDCGRPVANIRLRVHWSVLIMPVLFAMQFKDANFGQFLVLVLMDAVIIFGSIYLHELGHALTAMRLGYPVRDIKLYILGGLANISYAPTNANHDFAIIAFGPMVNFVLVGVSSLFVWLLVPLTGLTIDNGYYLDYWAFSPEYLFKTFFWTNLFLGVFNLIPMFPLDGGGMTRALFSMRHNANAVTLRVAKLGMYVVAPIMIGLGIIGLFLTNFFGSAFASMLLIVIAIGGIQVSMFERMRAQHYPIYSGGPPPLAQNPWMSAWDDDPGYGSVPYGGYAGDKPGTAVSKKQLKAEKKAEQKAKQAAEKAANDRQKVEELLDKISKQGITSLSAREKDFLKNASKRYQ